MIFQHITSLTSWTTTSWRLLTLSVVKSGCQVPLSMSSSMRHSDGQTLCHALLTFHFFSSQWVMVSSQSVTVTSSVSLCSHLSGTTLRVERFHLVTVRRAIFHRQLSISLHSLDGTQVMTRSLCHLTRWSSSSTSASVQRQVLSSTTSKQHGSTTSTSSSRMTRSGVQHLTRYSRIMASMQQLSRRQRLYA